ncbi:MAG: hypothetical protein JNM27_02760 [Leptospirales bacterium]|nr:hypothetical protein [Leptospirales bacterium]
MRPNLPGLPGEAPSPVRHLPLAALPPLYLLLARFDSTNMNIYLIFLIYTTIVAISCLYLFLNRTGGFHPPLLFGTAILSALPLIAAGPVFSVDILRYAWEGRVQNLGFNPYVYPPAHPMFESETLNRGVDLPGMTAVYQPLALMAFRLLAAIAPLPAFFKAIFFCFALGTARLLMLDKRSFGTIGAFFCLLPLTLIEIGWSGHLDVIGIFFLVFAVRLLKQNRGFLCGLMLACSAGTKFLPLILAPAFFLRMPRGERAWFVAGLSAFPLMHIPFLDAGYGLVRSLSLYSVYWAHNGFLYNALDWFGLPNLTVRLTLLCVFGVIWFFLQLRVRNVVDLIFLTFLALILCSPTAFPWYLLWLVPFGLRRFPVTTIVFLSGSFYTYWTEAVFLDTGVRYESALIRNLEYSAALATLCFEFMILRLAGYRLFRRSGHPTGHLK